MKQSQPHGLNSYKNIIKGTSFFGGIQIFNILITLIRGKFVATILGPEGMGIAALFNSVSNTIQRFSCLGINQSITREIADYEETSQKEEWIRTSLNLTYLTALLGFVICAAFCLPLSRLTFGEESYWWQFIILGLGVAFGIAATGKLSILQGLHEVKRISFASLIGGISGLAIGIPLYYIFGYKGIVPSIVIIFLSLYIFYSYSLKKSIVFSDHKLIRSNFYPKAKKILALGIVLMSGDLIASLVNYLINLFVRHIGSIDEVGLYQAANSITTQFAGMIFAALAMDYFPRLSKASRDNNKMSIIVNRQSEIVSWLITPAMALLILSTPLLIRILLSEHFHSIIPLMRWMGLGMLLRAFSFPMAYITYAKGNKKIFFLLEGIIANFMTLILSCLFFNYFGLIGLGYALVIDNGLCFILYFIVNKKLYGYNFSINSARDFIFGFMMVSSCFIFSFLDSSALSYTLMSVITLLTLIWGLYSIIITFRK